MCFFFFFPKAGGYGKCLRLSTAPHPNKIIQPGHTSLDPCAHPSGNDINTVQESVGPWQSCGDYPHRGTETTRLLVLFQGRPVRGCRTEGLPASWRKTRGGLSVQDAEETHFYSSWYNGEQARACTKCL